jgi:2-dehydropantoate 2-reductase
MPQHSPEIKNVCIYGVGGVGGYFGGKIAEAMRNNNPRKREIYFIARGKHLKAIQQNGIIVKTPDGIIKAKPTGATNDISTIPAPGLILICTKSYDLNSAVLSIKPKMKEHTVIIPLLNGVDIYERIREELKVGIILPACVYLGTHIESPGVINQSGGNGIILFGKDPQFPEYSAENIIQFFRETGIGFEWKDNPFPAIWEKFIFIAAFGLVTASFGKRLGEVMKTENLNLLVYQIMQEIAAIAEKKCVGLPDDIIKQTMRKASNFPYDARTSYQRDVESWPKPNEGDLYGGVILREGAKLGVPTPITDMVYHQILLLESKRQ